MTALHINSFEVGIDSSAREAERIAHETRFGRVMNMVAKITLDPILGFLVDHPFRVKEGEGAEDNNDR